VFRRSRDRGQLFQGEPPVQDKGASLLAPVLLEETLHLVGGKSSHGIDGSLVEAVHDAPDPDVHLLQGKGFQLRKESFDLGLGFLVQEGIRQGSGA
jgi:hypothetical protein